MGELDGLLVSRESLSIASVGGAGERTSVMLRVLRFDANGIETEGGWPADGAVQRTKETQMRKFWRWVSALQKGEQFVNRISGQDWNCSVAWLWDLL